MTIFNRGVRGKRSADGTNIGGISNSFVENKYPVPTITSWSISGSDDDALDTAGGQTVLVNGAGFVAGCAVTVNGATITPVTVVSPNQISFTSPANSGGSYTLVVYNSTGGGAILVPGLVYSSVPTYTTAQGSIGSGYETTSINTSVVATSDSTITYAITSGSLPSGASMTSGGVITGTYPTLTVGTSETFYFDITATDGEDQDVTRSFTLTTNIDVVAWVTPSSGATINLDGTAYSQALSATDAAGYSIASYTANALPTGLTLTSGTISGTPTVEGSTTTLLTATAATTGRSATNTVTWVVALGDIYFKNVSLLLSANSSIQTQSFASDNSINNAVLAISADTRAQNFNPYQPGYYSNFFDGNGDYLTVPGSNNFVFAGDYTIEAWILSASTTWSIYSTGGSGAADQFSCDAGTLYWAYNIFGGGTANFFTVADVNNWTHIAASRSSGTTRLFKNGVVMATSTTNSSIGSTNTLNIGRRLDGSYSMNGYISNFRIVKGTAIYTAAFTPSTTPLTAVLGTQLLTCQSNNLSDNSANYYTVTKVGDTMVSFANPFATAYQYGTPYYSVNFSNSSYVTANITGGLGSGDFTIEGWVRWTAAYGNSGIFHITPSGYLPSTGLGVALATYNNLWHLFQSNTGDPSGLGTSPALYTWYHFAMVRSGSTFKTYIDGVQIYSASDTTDYTSTTYLAIGAYYSSSYPFPGGNISNFRILRGTALYSGSNTVTPNFSVPTSPLTAITNTVFLGLQNSTLTDSSSNNVAISPASLSSIRVISASPFTPNSYSGTTLPTTYGSGYFDGSGDYITYGTFAPTGNFTFECWFFVKSYPQTQCMLFALPWPSGNFQVYVSNNNTVMWQAYTQNSQEYAITINQWYHLAIVKSGSSANLYLNGLLRDTSTLTNSISGVGLIGARNDGYNFAGYISDFRLVIGSTVYTSNFVPPTAPLSNITNTQLLTLQYRGSHNNSTFNDDSTHNNLVTRSGNATNGTFSPYSITGWSYYYPALGFNTYASNPISSFGAGTTFTVEGWVNVSVYPSTNYFFSLLASCDQASATYWAIGIGSTGLASVYWYDGNPKTCAGSTTLAKGTWYHVAVVVTSGVVKIYVNGNQETLSGTTTLTNPTGNSSYTTGTERGSSNGGSSGYISNLRTSTTAVYPSAFTPSTTPLAPAISSTVFATLLTAQSNRFLDNSPTAGAITLGSTPPTVQSFSPFGGVTSIPTSYSNYFNYADGSGDYISLPTSYSSTVGAIANSLITIEFWMFTTGISAVTGFRSGLFGNFTSSGVNGRYMIDSLGTSTTSTQKIELTYTTSTSTTATIATTTAITQNAWHHVAITIDSSTPATSTIKIYLDGVGQTFSSQNLSTHTTDPGVAFHIGSDGGGNYQQHTGYISNFRYVRGTIVYTGNFTVPTSPLATTQSSGTNIAAITGTATKLLTCQNSTIIENSNSVALTVTNTVQPRPFNPFGLTNTTNVPYSPTTNGGSMYFDGNSDFIRVTTNTAYNTLPASGFFTIEGWYYFSDVTINQQIIFTQRDFSSYQYVPYLIWTSSSGLVIYVSSDNGSWNIQNANSLTTGLSSNQWYHFAYTRSGNTFRFFVNGVQTYTFSSSAAFSNTGTFNQGMSPGETNTVFKGYVSDVRFLNGVCLYSSNFYPGSTPFTSSVTVGSTTYKPAILLTGTGSGVPDASRNVDLETVADAKVTNFSPYNGSYYSNYFDGTGDYLSFTGTNILPTGTEDFTVDLWFYRDKAFSAGGDFLTTASTNSGFNLYLNTTASTIRLSTYNVASIIEYSYSSLLTGTWYHLAISRSGSNIGMFINGTRVAFTSSGSNSFANPGTSYIGSTGFGGYISNARVVRGSSLYNPTLTTLTVPTAPLTAVSGTSLLTCQSNKFVDNSINNVSITRNGDTKVATQNPFQVNTGLSYYFDGTGDGLLFPGGTGVVPSGAGTAFTLEFWIYPTTAVTTILRCNGNGSSLGIATNSSRQVIISNTFVSDFMTTTSTLTLNQWNYVAITRTTANLYSVYINGDSAGTPVTYTTSLGLQSQYYIGYNTYTGGSYVMYIADFRITNGVVRTISVPTNPYKLN